MSVKRPALTVGDLRDFLAQVEAHHGVNLDAYPIHIMDLDERPEHDDGECANLATHVELDRFDEDGPAVVSIYKWQEAGLPPTPEEVAKHVKTEIPL